MVGHSRGTSLLSVLRFRCLMVCLFKVHNTFGESHTYVLEVGVNEDPLQDSARYVYIPTYEDA